MSKLILTTTCEIDGSHFLRDYKGKCANMHGHRWKVEVDVEGYPDQLERNNGMVLDFNVVKEVVDKYDHKLINDIPPFSEERNPTAENIAVVIGEELALQIAKKGLKAKVKAIRIWETPTNKVEYILD